MASKKDKKQATMFPDEVDVKNGEVTMLYVPVSISYLARNLALCSLSAREGDKLTGYTETVPSEDLEHCALDESQPVIVRVSVPQGTATDQNGAYEIKAPLPCSSIKEIVFQSEDMKNELGDRLRMFADVPLHLFDLAVRPGCFDDAFTFDQERMAGDANESSVHNPVMDELGKLGGVLASIKFMLQKTRDHDEHAEKLLSTLSSRDELGINAYEVAVGTDNRNYEELDALAWKSVWNIVRERGINRGVTPNHILSGADNLTGELSQQNAEKIHKWIDYVKRIQDGDKEIPTRLDDSSTPALRAALAFMFTKKIEAIESFQNDHRLGATVQFLVYVLGGLYEGLGRFHAGLKGKTREELDTFSEMLIDLYSGKPKKLSYSEIDSTEYYSTVDTVYYGDKCFLSRDIKLDSSHLMLIALARGQNYRVGYNVEAASYYIEPLGGGEKEKKQKIYFEILDKKPGDETSIVRYYTPLRKLGKKGLLKKEYEEYLSGAWQSGLALAITEISGANYLVVYWLQPISTFDDEEFQYLVSRFSNFYSYYEVDTDI